MYYLAVMKDKDQNSKLKSHKHQKAPLATAICLQSVTQANATHGAQNLVVTPVSQTSGALKTDVLLPNVQLVSAIQTPNVIWPSEGILKQALLDSGKSLKENEKVEVAIDSSDQTEQVTNSGSCATLVTISMTPQAPLFTTSMSQQVIMVSELGANQIILTGTGFPDSSTEVEDTSCKTVETSRINLDENEHDLLVIDDHNSFGTINVDGTNSNPINRNPNFAHIKTGFSLMQSKVFSSSHSSNSVRIMTHQHSNNLPELINQQCNDNIKGSRVETENSNGTTSNSNSNNSASNFEQETRSAEVEHHSADGSGELGYTAHLLSQLSGTGALPTMSSSQVSSVLSALEPSDKSTQLTLTTLDSVPVDKQRKISNNNDLHSLATSPSPEFVKVEGGISQITKTSSSKVIERNKLSSSVSYKEIKLNVKGGKDIPVYQCSDCGFLSLKEATVESHYQQLHILQSNNLFTIRKRELKCIGCDNTFFSKHALQVHLIEDHDMCLTEAISIVAAISKYNNEKEINGGLLKKVPSTESSTTGLSTVLADICQDKEPLYSPPSKQVHTATSLSLDTIKSSAAADQIVTTFPTLQLIVSSTVGHTISTPSLIVSTVDKTHSDITPTCSSQSLVSITSSSTTPSLPATIVQQLPSASHQFQAFTKGSSSTFVDQNLPSSKNDNRSDKQNTLKNENEMETVIIKRAASPENADQDSVVNGNNKKRGRPRGSQSLRLVRSKFKSESTLDKDLSFRCGVDACAVQMQSEANMTYHRQCHSNNAEIGFQCPECSFNILQWRNLTSHLWKVHNIDMELYSCTQCGYKTNSHSKLVNLHSRIHCDERPFLCDLCGKGFKTPKQLRNHKVIHRSRNSETNGESGRTLSCNICGRQVSHARNLRHHTENVHNKRRPYLCSFCGYAAASPSSLRMHSRQHTGEKPFSCDECEYTTADHNSLRRHKMRHSGNKPYQCPHCSYACIQSTTYKAHLKSKHPGMDEGLMFSCPACPFRTVKKDNFLTHTAEHVLAQGANNDKINQLRKVHDSNQTSHNLKSLAPTMPNVTPNNRLHVASSVLTDNNTALQNLVKHVSSSIIPTSQLETVAQVNIPQEATLVSLELKDSVPLSHTTDVQLPVAGLAHGEIIISDQLHLEDSETESLNGELIVPESQSNR